MADSGYTKPTNAIVVAGSPMVQYLKVEAVANMYPGRLVMKGSSDAEVVVNARTYGDDGRAIGWLGYEQTQKGYRPDTVNDIYLGADSDPSVNVTAAVLSGPGTIIVGSLAVSQTVAKGDRLFDAAAGQLTKLSGEMISSGPVAIAEESVSTSSIASIDIMVRRLI